MKKIPTVFERDWTGDRSRVVDKANPDCQWVLDGEGVATIKQDGTCCLVRDGKLYKRRELKPGQATPPLFEQVDHDVETSKTVGWVPCDIGPEDRWHMEAFEGKNLPDGTYELIGPKVQGNPEHAATHMLSRHGRHQVEDVPRSFDGLREFLSGKDIEGIVFHHSDGRMAKIKLRDFGLKRLNV